VAKRIGMQTKESPKIAHPYRCARLVSLQKPISSHVPDGTFSATLSNAGRLSTLTAVNIHHTETRRGNARLFLRSSQGE
jgi:hypothetical protein